MMLPPPSLHLGFRMLVIVLFNLLLYNNLPAQEPRLVDSLIQLVQTAQDTQRVKYLCELCYELNYQDAKAALPYCKEALSLAEALAYKKGQASALQYLGVNAQGQGNYEQSLAYQVRSLALFKSLKDTLAVANLQNNIGIIYDEQGDFKKALDQYFIALEIYENQEKPLSIAQAYNNIGIVYKKQKNFDKVIEYYSKALEIYRGYGHAFGQAVMQGNLGSIFLDQQDYQTAIQYSEAAYQAYDSLQVRQYQPYPLGNIGRAYNGLKNPERATDFLQRALNLHEEFGDKRAIAFTQVHLAEAYFTLKDYERARVLATAARDGAQVIGANDELKEAYLQLAKIHQETGSFQEAYTTHLQYTAIKDTLFEVEKTKQMAELQTKYETTQKEQKIAKQSLQIERANYRNKIVLVTAIGIVLALISLGVFAYYFYQNKQKELQRRKEKAYEQQLLVASIEATEFERKRIAADLHDGIGQQLMGLKMGWQQVSDQVLGQAPEVALRLKKLMGILDEATVDVRTISHQMMPKTLSEIGLVAAIESMVDKSFSHTHLQYEMDSFGIKDRLPEATEIGVFRIAQEAVNNILRHAEATEVSIQLYRAKGNIILSVEDNGKGFNPAQLDSRRRGHGLMNMESRAKAIGGSLSFEAGVEGGTIMKLKL
ncbi:MAG: tetratricopeptide repeat protein [Saprospiraceae bacterium]